MAVKLLVFDSHPVQYRVPIWRQLASLHPGEFHVVYASDCSVRGHEDKGFGKNISWDDPMLEGYEHSILNCEKGKPLSGWGSLTGAGVKAAIEQFKPSAILLTGINYKFDLVAYFTAKKKLIPVWLRCETQDEALPRNSALKSVTRSLIYNIAYSGFDHMLYIGELNKAHYLQHGVPERKLIPARYGTVNRFSGLTDSEKNELRVIARNDAKVGDDKLVIGFSGKFITKKNPEILFDMLQYLPREIASNIFLYFMGSGEQEQLLQSRAADALAKYGIQTYFSGFVNQSQIAKHYLAIDVLVLPSRRMGETWGLVTNEAMQAGCSVIVSDAVGSAKDFNGLERFRVFNEGDAEGLSLAIADLSKYQKSFNWADKGLEPYTIESVVQAISENIIKQA